MNTMTEAFQWGKQLGLTTRSFSPSLQQGKPVRAYSPQCAVLLYVARDHSLLGMTKANAVKAVLEAFEKQLADDYPLPLPEVVKVVAKTPPVHTFPEGTWFTDASVSNTYEDNHHLGTGVAAYNPYTGKFLCKSIPLRLDTTDAEAYAIDLVSSQNPERVYTDSAACCRIMQGGTDSKRVNARKLLIPLRGKFALEKIDRKQNVIADKLAKWARYHQASVAGKVEMTTGGLKFSELKSLELVALEQQAKSLADKSRALEASLTKARKECEILSKVITQQQLLDDYYLGGWQ